MSSTVLSLVMSRHGSNQRKCSGLTALELPPAKAARHVVHDEAGRLQVGVTDDGAEERETPPPQVRAHLLGERRLGGDLREVVPGVENRHAADKAPDVAVEGAELVPDLEERPGVSDRALHLSAVADDAGIAKQPLDVDRPETRDCFRLEATKGVAIAVPALEDREPAQAGLGGLENQELEVTAVVVDGHSPLGVVIELQEL